MRRQKESGPDFWEVEKPSDWLPAAHKYRKPKKKELEPGGLLGESARKPEKPRNRSLLAGGEPEKKQQSEQSGSWGSEPKKKSRNKQSGFDWFHPYGDAAPDLTGAANRKESKPKPAPEPKPAPKADQPVFGPVEGHAAATLGGPDDGKVRRLDGGTGGEEEVTQRDSYQDAYELRLREQRQLLGDPSIDHRTEHEKQRDTVRSLAPGLRALDEAKKHVGSLAYRKGVAKDNYKAGDAKCNKFVYDVHTDVDNYVPLLGGSLFGRGWPVGAGQWGNKYEKIPGWKTVPIPRPGDVAAQGGHVGIVSGKNTTISAASPDHGDKVVENDWGFRPEQKGLTVFWRYIGKPLESE